MSDQEEVRELEVVQEVVPQTDSQLLNQRVAEADELEAGGEPPFPAPRHEYVVLRLHQLKTSINDSFLEMASLLVEANEQMHWRPSGYDSFSDYVESTVGMKYRTARYLMTVHETFIQRLNVPRPMLMEIGWTKLKEIAKVSDADNVNQWLETARSNRTSALIQIVRQQATTERVEEYSTLSVGCFEAEKRIIQDAIDLSMRETENDRPGHNLSLICAGYAAEARGRANEAAGTIPANHTEAEEAEDQPPDEEE